MFVQNNDENQFSGIKTSCPDESQVSYVCGQIKCQYLIKPENMNQDEHGNNVFYKNIDIKKVCASLKSSNTNSSLLHLFSFKHTDSIYFHIVDPEKTNSSCLFETKLLVVDDGYNPLNINLPDYSCGIDMEVYLLSKVLDQSKNYATEDVSFELRSDKEIKEDQQNDCRGRNGIQDQQEIKFV